VRRLRDIETADKKTNSRFWTKERSVQTDPGKESKANGAHGEQDPAIDVEHKSLRHLQPLTAMKRAEWRPTNAKKMQRWPAKTGDQSNPEWLKVPGRKKTNRRTRPSAILVDAQGKTFSEMLTMIIRREDDKLSKLSNCFKKARRTADGKLPWILAAGNRKA